MGTADGWMYASTRRRRSRISASCVCDASLDEFGTSAAADEWMDMPSLPSHRGKASQVTPAVLGCLACNDSKTAIYALEGPISYVYPLSAQSPSAKPDCLQAVVCGAAFAYLYEDVLNVSTAPFAELPP